MTPIVFEASDYEFAIGEYYPVINVTKVGLLQTTINRCLCKTNSTEPRSEPAIEYAKQHNKLNRHYAFVLNDNRLLISDENGELLHIVCNPIINFHEGKTEWK